MKFCFFFLFFLKENNNLLPDLLELLGGKEVNSLSQFHAGNHLFKHQHFNTI